MANRWLSLLGIALASTTAFRTIASPSATPQYVLDSQGGEVMQSHLHSPGHSCDSADEEHMRNVHGIYTAPREE